MQETATACFSVCLDSLEFPDLKVYLYVVCRIYSCMCYFLSTTQWLKRFPLLDQDMIYGACLL